MYGGNAVLAFAAGSYPRNRGMLDPGIGYGINGRFKVGEASHDGDHANGPAHGTGSDSRAGTGGRAPPVADQTLDEAYLQALGAHLSDNYDTSYLKFPRLAEQATPALSLSSDFSITPALREPTAGLRTRTYVVQPRHLPALSSTGGSARRGEGDAR